MGLSAALDGPPGAGRGAGARDRRRRTGDRGLPDRSARRSTTAGWPTGSRCQGAGPPGGHRFVYESRPNVTVDAAALCLKSGNAVLLRGSARRRTPTHARPDRPRGGVVGCLPGALGAGRGRRPRGAGRARTLDRVVDLIIPRGGEGLKKAISAVASVPSSTPRRATATSTWTRGRPRHGRPHYHQRQVPAARDVQLRGDAARALVGGGGVFLPRGARGAALPRGRAARR